MFENTLSVFLAFRKAEGLSDVTIGDYAYHLRRLAGLVPKGTEDYRSAALAYLSDASNPNTYNIRFKYLKKFFDWCLGEGVINACHPLKGLKKRKPTGRIIHIENDVLSDLLALPDRKTFVGLRDYALMLFSLDCGARPGESLRLHREDFNFSGLLATIPAPVAKTRMSRTLPITIQTVAAIQVLLHARHPQWSDDVPVFCTADGAPYPVNSWGNRLRKHYSDKLGTSITPYYLRHAAALGMLRAGMSVFALRDMLGHTDISMTQKYLALTLEDLRREHEQSNLVNAIAPKRNRVRKI